MGEQMEDGVPPWKMSSIKNNFKKENDTIQLFHPQSNAYRN